MQFFRDVDVLWAVRYALSASYAMAGLAKFRYTPVVSHEVCPAGFSVFRILARSRDVAFVEAFVVVQQDGRNVEAVRTRHAVFAVIARDGLETHHDICNMLQESQFFFR